MFASTLPLLWSEWQLYPKLYVLIVLFCVTKIGVCSENIHFNRFLMLSFAKCLVPRGGCRLCKNEHVLMTCSFFQTWSCYYQSVRLFSE